jgi:predicted amidohydrolase YtcJ
VTGRQPAWLFRRAELAGRRVADVRVSDGFVTEVSADPLRAGPGETVVDAAGGALLPGLHDHHIHLMSLAAAASSVHVGPPGVLDGAGLRRALRSAAEPAPAPGPEAEAGVARWIRAVGYHPAVAGDLDRLALDEIVPDRPVRLQYRTGELWVLNSLAVKLAGVGACPLAGVERDAAGRPTGRLWRLDSWLREAVPPVPVDLAGVGRAAAAAGVVGFTDATPARTAAEQSALVAAVVSGSLPQRLTLMRGCPDGRRSPDGGDAARAVIASGRLSWGPTKIILDDATLPDPASLATRIRASHRSGRPVAVHCVTRVQLVVALAALDEAGARDGDRIEHAAVVPPELRGPMRSHRLTVVTQPIFIAERGDRYLADVTDEDPQALYPAASLLAAGVRVAAGTDAPFGGPDPWRSIAAAIDRRTAGGTVLGPGERLRPAQALGLFLGEAAAPHRLRSIRPGAVADLCLLRLPRDAALRQPSAGLVALTTVAGRLVGA